MHRFLFIFSGLTLILLSGCVSTEYAKSSAIAHITEQRIKLDSAPSHWGVNKLIQVGDTKLGHYGSRHAKRNDGHSGVEYTFDAGPTSIAAWYYDNQTGSYLVNQSPITKMQANLRPQGRYELRSIKNEDKLQFMLVDLELNTNIAASEWVRLTQQPLPEPAGVLNTPALLGLFHFIK